MRETMPAVKASSRIRREAPASKHIPIVGHYDETTLIDKDGRLIKLYQLNGMDFFTQTALTRDLEKQRLGRLLKRFSSSFALYYWIIRKRASLNLTGTFQNPLAATWHTQYKETLQKSPLFENKLYLAVIAKTPEGKVSNLLHFLNQWRNRLDTESYEARLKKTHSELMHLCEHVAQTLKSYGLHPLGLKKNRQGETLSESLTFLSRLINVKKTLPIRLVQQRADTYLPQHRLFFHTRSGTLVWRRADDRMHWGAMLSLKGYPEATHASFLEALENVPCEMILTQSFRFFDLQAAKSTIKNQQKDLAQLWDESQSQTEQLSETLDDAASGSAGLGLHHLSLLCLAKDKLTLQENIAKILSVCAKQDITCVREDLACEMAFWAQLPGNFAYIPREAVISTQNLAGFIGLHNTAQGQAKNNHWGEACTLMETYTQSPYFFNHHDRDVGNTLIFGSMGSGKTLLMGFLLAQSLKWGGKRVVFDKDRGLEILIRALGGTYERLKPGIATGFNPCQMPDTAENRAFLKTLLKKMLTVHNPSLDEADADRINKAVERLYGLPLKDRRLRHLAPFLGVKTQGSLRARFDLWHSEGEYAWLFDQAEDTLNLKAAVMGFDMGNILSAEDVKTPAMMYLMHRIENVLQGHRGAIYMDEGWLALQDAYFQTQIDNESRTPRKKNRFLCLATQSADDAVKSPINRILCANAPCKIFFPDASARRETYIDGLGLNEREYHLIKTLGNEGHYCLVHAGYGHESVVARLPLQNLPQLVATISGRQASVKLLDTLRETLGDDPVRWLPVFQKEILHA